MNYKKIEKYYNRALKAIQHKDYKKAFKILHNEMSIDLYDESLNILFNRNINKENLKLKDLIEKVDNLINKQL